MPVPDLGVAADRSHVPGRQRRDQAAQGVGLEDGVAVDEHQDLAAGFRDAPAERARLPGVSLADDPDVGEGQAAGDGRGGVGRAVVDDDDLDPAAVAAGGHGTHRGRDSRRLVVRRDHHRHVREIAGPVTRGPGSVAAGPAAVHAGQADEQRQPDDGQRARRDEQDRQHGHGMIGGLLDEDQRRARQSLAAGGRHVAGRHPQAAGHGGEPVALGAQPGDDDRERGDGLPAVSAPVMEHDDGAPAAGRNRGGHDPRDSGPGPVSGVEVGQHHEVPVQAGLPGRAPVRGGQRVRLRGIRHPQQPGANPGRPGERVLGQRQLEARTPPRGGEVNVRVGVRAHLVAVTQLLAHQARVTGRMRADHEERRGHPVPAKDREDAGRPGRVRPVVEGQRDGPGGHRVTAHASAGHPDDRAAAGDRGRRGCGMRSRVRLVGAALAEHAAGVALDREPDREDQHHQGDQNPVSARGAGLAMAGRPGRRGPAAPRPRTLGPPADLGGGRPLRDHECSYAGWATWCFLAACCQPGW